MQDYFELFSLPQGYAIDKNALQAQFVALQKKWHPDSFPQGGLKDKAQAKSVLINQGYAILSSDVERAIHLLQLKGAQSLNSVQHDINYLEQELERQESLQIALDAGDESRIQQFYSEELGSLESLKDKLTQLFQEDTLNTHEVQQCIYRMQFNQKKINQIKEHWAAEASCQH